jgi:Ligated ion channel L-glutamate- and glycine-binding site
MLRVILLNFIFSIQTGSCNENLIANDHNNTELSLAVIKVMTEICAREKSTSSVIFDAKCLGNLTFLDEINFIMHRSSKSAKISLQIATESNESNSTASHREKCIVIFVSTCSGFMEMHKKFSTHLFNHHSTFLVVLMDESYVDERNKIVKIFDILWQANVHKVNAMFKDEKGVSVVTFFPFQRHNCRDISPKVINNFLNGTFVNSTRDFFPTKMLNLEKCPVNVSTSNNTEPYIFATKYINDSYDLRGRDITLLNTLAEALNFEINYVYIGREGVLLENGTTTGALKRVVNGSADIAVCDLWLKANRIQFVDFTTAYSSQTIAFVIPPGSPLTPFEKYMCPLDTWTWLLLTLVIVIAFIVIYVVKRLSQHAQNFIFGNKVNDPYLNVLVAVFGMSQHVLPHRNFPRFLLTIFLLFCLVMRTVYQGSLYRFLQMEMNHKEVQSIDEMIERDFKFYIVPSIIDLVEGHPRIYERLMGHYIDLCSAW